MDANVIASREAKKMIEELDEHMQMVGGKVDNVIAVLNRIDLVRRGNEDDVERVIKKAREIYSDTFIDIVPISAKDAMDGLKNKDLDRYRDSGLPRLRESIDRNFSRRASKIKCNSKLNGLKGYLNDINQIILPYHKRLLKDNSRRKQLLRYKDYELEKLRRDIKDMLGRILDDYRNMVFSNIESKTEELFNFDEENKAEAENFIKNQIFCVDVLNKRLNKFQENYKKKMEIVAKKLINDSHFKEFKYIDDKALVLLKDVYYSQNMEFQLISDEFSNYSFFGSALSIAAGALFLGPVGIILGILANSLGLVRFAVTKIKLPGLKNKLKEELQKITSDIEKKVNKGLGDDIRRIEKKVDKTRELSFASLHGSSNKVNDVFKAFIRISDLSKEELEYRANVIKLLKGEDM